MKPTENYEQLLERFTKRIKQVGSQTSANRSHWWDLDECLKIADCHGYYLNKDPEENMPL